MPYYIGLMSGTSADGIDAVLVDIEDQKIELLQSISVGYEKSLYDDIIHVITQPRIDLSTLGRLNIRLGNAFADAVTKLTHTVNREHVVAIGSHGQTVYHHPEGDHPFTLQLGDGATIAVKTGIDTVTDFRSSDMVAGGQGAPLAPLFHQHFFGSATENRTIINVGGIANLTYLPMSESQAVTGFDTGPGNALMDAWTKLNLGTPFDRNGEWAMAGELDQGLLENFLADRYFEKRPPKSTGKEYFNLDWLNDFIDINTAHPQNVQTTLAHLTAASIGRSVTEFTGKNDAVYLCGGGTGNGFLVNLISHYCGNRKVDTTQALGVDPDFVEAIAFAWLAKSRIDRKTLDTTHITGACRPVTLGAIYSGR